ncbi:MAG: hypothetical protein GYB64_06540 [Chloroflexi bacterium]|nr:hypothetical protein [Chloroflexota bacterium]
MADDDFYFSFDDEEGEAAADEELEAEQSSNRGFLIGALVLGAVFAIAICLIGVFLLRDTILPGGGEQVSDTQLTNEANMTIIAQTEEAVLFTDEPPTDDEGADTGEVPTEEGDLDDGLPPDDEGADTGEIEEPTVTPTSDLVITTVPDDEGAADEGEPDEGTPVDEETPTATEEGGAVDEPTATFTQIPTEEDGEDNGLATPTPLAPRTSGVIEVTPIGGGDDDEQDATDTPEADDGLPTPTPLSGDGESGVIGTETPVPTGEGGPIAPTGTATLPVAGFTGGTGLIGAGLLAVALVFVVIVVRRIRLT